MAAEFYPSVSSIITLDDLPQELDFIQTGVSSVFDHVYFRDLQFTRSPKGDSAYYSLVLILNRSVGITIPGADIKIALNPDFQTGTLTEIPVTLEYEWKLLALLKKIKKFTTGGFSFDAKAFFDLLADITGLTKEGLLQNALQQFTGASDPIDAVNLFIDDANTKYGTSVPHTSETDLKLALAEAIAAVSVAAQKDPFTVIYDIYIDGGSAEEMLDKVKNMFAPFFDIDPVEYIKEILIPKINATLSLSPTGIGIIFPRKYLVPLDPSNNLQPFPETGASTDKMSILGFGLGKLTFSTVSGFGYDEELTATLNYPSMIGNTGLIIDLQDAKLDLSRKKNIPEATADGRPEDFMGVYIQEASITLPEKWFKQADHTTAKIYGRRLLIGTGGLSGEIGLEATAAGQALPPGQTPAVKVKLGSNDGFELGFEKFSLTFRQNAITACEIRGYIMIKGFKDSAGNDARIEIVASISDNGDFTITASEDQGISLIRIPDIVNVNIKSLSVGRRNDLFFVAVSGNLDFADQSGNSNGGFIADNLPKDIEIQKLLIWQDGTFEFEGGGIELRKPLTLRIPPVELSITAIHFGSHEQMHNGIMRKYKFFGFDGGVSVKPGGVDARGDGVKFYFTVDNGPGKPLDVFMRIQSIAIDIMIPGTATPQTAAVIMKGYLAMKSPSDSAGSGSDAGTEYAGSIELTLPKLKIAGSAAMRYNPSVPAFVIDLGLELPTALPLGSTGLGIYAFRGLFGLRYVASREYVGLPADAEWWQYYKKKVAPDNREGIFINKMEQREGFSVGAGVSLSTLPDGGRTFSSKIFFMLSLPEVFLLQGQATFLSERISLNDPNDPPFFALIAISSTSIEAALGVNYKMPNSGSNAGKIVKVDGVLELAFFWGNSFGWYLNLGRETPEERRIRARIFDLFDCYFFLMLSSEGIYAGAGASYKFNKTFVGVVKVRLEAYLDIRGKIAFKPLQVGGSIQLGAALEISVFRVGFGLSADAGLAAEAPKPFIISGFIRVKFKVLLKTFQFNIDFTWNFDNQLDLSEIGLFDPVLENIAKAINAHTKEAFPVYVQKLAGTGSPNPLLPWADFEKYTLPMDSFIDIEFKQGVHATGSDPSLVPFNDITSGFEYTALVPPQKGKSNQVKHEFYVDRITLSIWNPQTNAWVDYHPYKAMSPLADLPNLDISPHATFDQYVDAQKFKFGSWQLRQPNKYNVLRVMATNPLSYMTQGVPFIPEELHITSETIFCTTPLREKICIRMVDIAWRTGDRFFVPANRSISYDGVVFRLTGADGQIVTRPYAGIDSALQIMSNESLEVYLPEPAAQTSFLLQMTTAYTTVRYYSRVQTGFDVSQVPVFGWQLVESQTVSPAQVSQPVVYENQAQPVGRIVLTAGPCSDAQPVVYPAAMSAADAYSADSGTESSDTVANPVNYDMRIAGYESFLNTLVRTKHLGNVRETNIATGNMSDAYREFLQKGRLWDEVPAGDLYLLSRFNRDASLYIDIFDKEKAWRSEIALRPTENISLEEHGISAFRNLRPDPAVRTQGPNYDFLVDADIVVHGIRRTMTLEGSSNIAVGRESGQSSARQTEFSPIAGQVSDFLRLLAENKRLVQTRKLNIVSGKYASEFEALRTSGFIDEEADTYFEAEQAGEADISLYLSSGSRRNRIMLETREDAPEEFSFGNITSFENMRPDPSGPGRRGRRFFLIDAVSGRKKTTLRGETSFDISREADQSPAMAAMVAPGPIVGYDCDELTAAAQALPRFIGTLGRTGFLAQPEPMQLIQQPEFQEAYFNTPLFPEGAMHDMATWRMESEEQEFRVVNAVLENVVHGEVLPCHFRLEVAQPDFPADFRNLVDAFEIQADPQEGQGEDTVTFTAVGHFAYQGQFLQTVIRGRSCYPIARCRPRICMTFIYRFCYLTEQNYIFNQTIPNISVVQQNNQAMVEAMSKLLQPVWRPQSVFGIRIHTRDRLTAGGSFQAEYSNAYFFGFKTAGPPGHFHEYLDFTNSGVVRQDYAALLAADKEDEFKQRSLKYYIDMDKSYPNADGRLTLAKPLFYHNPRLLLFFVKDYVYTMYNDWNDYQGNRRWDSNIRTAIIDPAENPDASSTLYLDAEWEKNESPYVGTDEQVLVNFLDNGVICTTTTQITSFGINASFIAPELKPLKTYTAQFSARFKRNIDADFIVREVHRYVFATSRYPDFSSQVNSYITLTEYHPVTGVVTHQEKAVYDLPLNLAPADTARVQSVLTGSDPDSLRTEFIHIYDRLMDGGFRMEALDAAQTTEFNIVRNSNGNAVMGILIRNPEPFNDPKIPVATLDAKKVIELSVNGGASSQFRCIYSKDTSFIFVTPADNSLNMPVGSYAFSFRYLEYDANIKDYKVAATVAGITFNV